MPEDRVASAGIPEEGTGLEATVADEIEAGVLGPPPDELADLLPDPDCGPPEGADAWLAELASPLMGAILDAWPAAGPAAPGQEQQSCPAGVTGEAPHATTFDEDQESFPAGVAGHDGRGPGGPGFGSGSALDGLEPGPVLAAALDDAWEDGLTRLSDDELAGVTLAWRRCESRAAAGLLAAAGELSRRRLAGGSRQVIEHLDDELAVLLTSTRRSAGRLLEFADDMARLPATMAALAHGRIDRARADVIAYETGLLDDALAAVVEQLVIEDASALTASELRARLHRAVLAADPGAARRRAEQAVRDARVELINERAGTAGLAGRDLPVPATLAADQRIDATARALKAAGAGPVIGRGSVHLTMPLAAWLGITQSPGEIAGFGPAEAGIGREIADLIADNPGSRWCLTLTDAGGHAVGHGCARRLPPGRRGNSSHGQKDSAPPESAKNALGSLARPPGSLAGLLGGPHGPPGRTPGSPGLPEPVAGGLDGIIGWLREMQTGPVDAGACSHAREVPGYRIPGSLHHAVKTRQRTCSAPHCTRPAERCDNDHTIPYDQGGRTCECNLAPLCRRHHRAKQAQGWRLVQPSPGVLVWELPHGRRYTVTPGVYPT